MNRTDRENSDNVEEIKKDLSSIGSIQDLGEILKMMESLEKDNTSHVQKWEMLKKLIHVVIDHQDHDMSKGYV